MKRSLLPFASLIILTANISFAQHRTCGTPDLPIEYETWLAQFAAQERNSNPNVDVQTAYTIPVIVHIVNNGESVGTGTNISQTQVTSQFTSLNKDFSLTNTDFASVCPASFQSAASNLQITFCKALRDPAGNALAEPGIERINRNTAGFSAPPYSMAYCDGTIKIQTIWNPRNYLNIWVLRLSGGILGYATFPAGSTLTGLTSPFGNSTSDGVVIQYDAFGTTGTVSAPYNKGRTATHEIGHWMGLRHIWGDDSNIDGVCNGSDACSGSDFCNDTPNACDCHYGAPSFPQLDMCSPSSPGTMYVNYMDYTDDASMVMFTANQKTRTQTAMANGTYRAPLASSFVCSPLGVASVTAGDKFKFYPNPTNGKLTVDVISMGSDLKVTIYNLVGEVVKEFKVENTMKFDVDLSDKQNGMYFITLSSASEKITQKFTLTK